jgi:hypothetical protein
MIPHIKGLSISRVEVELKEHYIFSVLDSKNALIAEKKMERSIRLMYSDFRPIEDDEWNIRGHIEVPNSLDRCTQDCDANFIKVKHRYVSYYISTNCSVKFVIGLQNADGHISEVRASLPVALVLPPYISSAGTAPHLDDSTVNHLSYLDSTDGLPSYESRIYDRLWDGVSYGGLDSSTLNTPIVMSRRASAENLRELHGSTMPHPRDLEASLHRALQEQNTLAPEYDHSSDAPSSSGSITPTHSLSITRPVTGIAPLNGDDDNDNYLSPLSSPELQHITPTISIGSSRSALTLTSEELIDVDRLSRVPSYDTANSSVLNLDPITNALPTYASATSNLAVIPERSRSRPGSIASTPVASRSPSAGVQQPPPINRDEPAGNISNGFANVGRIASVYGAPHTFDDPMRRISLMRTLFSSR